MELQRREKETLVRWLLDIVSVITPRIMHGKATSPSRVGILLQWGVGDAVLMLPLLRGLREHLPVSSIELIGKPWLADLFAGENICNRTHVLVPFWTAYTNKYRPSKEQLVQYLREVRAVRKEKFDWLIGARCDPRESLQLRLLRARQTFGLRAAGGRFWVDYDVGGSRSLHDRLHRAQFATHVLRQIIPSAINSSVTLTPNEQARNKARQWLLASGCSGSGHILAVHSGAGNPLRHWREAHFDGVIRALVHKPAFVVFIDEATPMIDCPLPQALWHGSLNELKALLSLCHVFLGSDSGVMHIAAASGCRVVTPFGPTEPRWFAPIGDQHIVVAKPIECRPCFDSCIYDRPICYDRLTDQMIAAAVDAQFCSVKG